MSGWITACFTALLVFFQLNPVGAAKVSSEDFGQVEIYQHASTENQSFVFIIRDSFNDSAAFARLAKVIARQSVTVIGIDLTQARLKFESSEGRSKFGPKLVRLAEAIEKSLGEVRFTAPDVLFINDRKALSLDLRFSSIADELGRVETLGKCPGADRPSGAAEADSGKMVEDHFVDAFVPADEACDRVIAFQRAIQVHPIANRNFDPYTSTTWPREVSERFRMSYDGLKPLIVPNLRDRSPEERFPVVSLMPQKILGDHFVFLLSGDGGWSDFTQDLASEYTARGIPVVGLNSLLYFWNERTPAAIARDFQQITEYYQKLYHLSRYDLVGYSFGGSVVPVVVAHMSETAKESLRSATMMAPGMTSKLEFAVSDWLLNSDSGRPIENDLKNSRGTRFKCLHGARDLPSVCLNFPRIYGRSFILEGGHHFGYNFQQFEGILY